VSVPSTFVRAMFDPDHPLDDCTVVAAELASTDRGFAPKMRRGIPLRSAIRHHSKLIKIEAFCAQMRTFRV